ncbi:ATP-dependent endonuclease [Bacillus sp. AFS077874]|uniref:ATP-dependent nuclease n=1 Tax=Bacillus sp. AFS077874 TaxID=2033513 RepID=UPI000BF8C42D|nr:AAA family ATPase [Bacillus sp. AFS077874]PFM75250.1 ATP-dependent endonuclease [Bacillus sp. AFS077874]
MTISKLVINNFKSYQKYCIEFKNDINIIVGNNEAGKSTILEAINLVLSGQLHGKNIIYELSPYIFNLEIVNEYITSLRDGKIIPPPRVYIELYLEDKEKLFGALKGTNNSLLLDCPGIYMSIEFDTSFESEYKEYINNSSNIQTIPIEYYTVKWYSFANNAVTYRSIPINSTFIDTSTIRMQNGTDKYISKIIHDTLESKEKTELAIQYRKLKENFSSIEPIKEINEKLNRKKGEISDKQLSVSVDISQKSNWETMLISYLNEVPFDFIGKGEQSAVKMKLAMEAKSTEDHVVLIEEPENHLSYSNMHKLLGNIKAKNQGKQIILTTHSSFILNKLDISNMLLLNNNKEAMSFKDLPDETRDYFMKLPGYDTLRILLSQKVILVEGPSDELIVQRAYIDKYGKLPIEDGVDVFCVDALSFKRFLDISIGLKKVIHVITDNDGDIEKNIKNKYKDYLGNEYVKIFYGDDINYSTLEPQLIKANESNLQVLKKILNHENYTKDRLTTFMINNKTKCALKIFEAQEQILMPRYIMDAIKK